MLARILRAAAALPCAGALGLALLVAPPAQATEPTPRPLSSGWFGWWATQDQVEDLAARNGGATGEVNVFWWFFDGPARPLCTYDNDSMSGDCVVSSTPWTTRRFQAMRTTLQDSQVRVLASFTDLDPGRAGQLATYISSPENRRSFARKIRIWAKQAGVDGVDLDIAAGERVATVTQVTAGTTLKVTPRLVAGPEPSIQLTIDIEDGQAWARLAVPFPDPVSLLSEALADGIGLAAATVGAARGA